MAVREIVLLGNPLLYEIADEISMQEVEYLRSIVDDMHDTLMDFRKRNGMGRAIAAPQIGIKKRLVYMKIEEPVVFINPIITFNSEAMIELWDDCMSFPNLLVKVRRHKKVWLEYRDMKWEKHLVELEDAMSELLQHECDHLDGILAVSRAIDARSFALKGQIAGR
jgi:peptide deformylase